MVEIPLKPLPVLVISGSKDDLFFNHLKQSELLNLEA